MYVKKHLHGGNAVLTVCDEDILGKIFENENMKLEVSESFFGGKSVDDKEVELLLKEFGNINIIGKKIVKLALNLGIVNKADIKYVGEIPFVVIFEL